VILKFAPAATARKPARRDKPEMTLDRALSRAGVASRTDAARLIAAGRVRVDGRVLGDAQAWVAPARQRIELDGQPLGRPKPLYLALHKPMGVITSHGDPQGRRTIYDLVGEQASWYFPVGRLDQDTRGLLLLTNDSVFADRVASPGGKVDKTYRAMAAPSLSDAEIERLRGGLDIGRGERSGPARVRRSGAAVEIILREGKNRQVRRMIEALGHKVEDLIRIQVGKLQLGDLPEGRVRGFQPRDVF
jgi:23S rRNA pseudouridine2605 synthase